MPSHTGCEGRIYHQHETETRMADEQTTEAAVTQFLLYSNYVLVKLKRKE